METTLKFVPAWDDLPDFHDTTISHVVIARLSSGRTIPAYCEGGEWYDATNDEKLVNPEVTHWCDFPLTK